MTDRARIWYNGAVNEWFREGGNMRNHVQLADAYYRLSDEERKYGESASITNQELICKGWFLPPNTYDCGSFVVNGTAVVGKE